MRMFKPSAVWGSALAAMLGVCLCATSAFADQTYAIKLNMQPGDKWTFDVFSTMNVNGNVTSNGQVVQPINQNMQQRRKGTAEVLTSDNGVPTSLKISFDAESDNGGPKLGGAFPLAGKTVTIKKENGVVSNDLPTPPDAQTAKELERMLEPDTSTHPKEPVAINQEWEGDNAVLGKQFQLAPDDKANMHCKLIDVKEEQGRQVADVHISATLLKREKGDFPIESRITLSGDTHIDLQSGQTVFADIGGAMTLGGTQTVNSPNGPAQIVADAKGDLSVKQSAQFLSNAAPLHGPSAAMGNVPTSNVPVPTPDAPAAPSSTPAPAPTPAPTPAMNPTPTPAPAPAPAAITFAGIYRNDQLSLELTGDNDALTGSLNIGDKKFPVTAKADGANLTGSFASDGAKFNFTAALDADTLTLKSDGATHVLKHVVNPLAVPAARNPLAQ